MGTKERRQREREELRAKILDAARAMFVERGYEAVTMRDLAKRIEYSPTAIYHHFKDKEALFRELCTLDMQEMHTALEKIAGSEPDLIKRIKLCAVEHVRFALEHKAQYQLLFLTPAPRGVMGNRADELPEADMQAYRSLRQHFVDFVGTGKSRYDDPDLLAQVYFSGLLGIVAAIVAMGGCPIELWRKPDALAETFADALVNGLLKH